MRYALVVPDIATRALNQAYHYRIPLEFDTQSLVGTTVLVSFARRNVVGYVIGLSAELPKGLDDARVKPIMRILADAAFDEVQAELAQWVSREYAAPLSESLRLLLAPGQSVKVKRADNNSPWELICDRVGSLDLRWVELTPAAASFEPRQSASRQRAVIAALREGPMRVSELAATMGSVDSAIKALEKKGVLRIESRRQLRGSIDTSLSSAVATRPEKLTSGQHEALTQIGAAYQRASGDVVLIDGVTGSGKTEVYLAAIDQVLLRGQSAIVLVPEISLTPQTLGRFRSRFGDQVAVLHSKLSAGERFDQWDMLRQGLARVVVGARSALFAPLSDLGLIVIDEEHEQSYKQDSQPRYHAREVAAQLAQLRSCTLVLGSATPSIESLDRCEQGSWRGVSWTRVEMHERPGIAQMPRVRVVDMCNQFHGGNRSIFSGELKLALLAVRDKRQKAVLLLNRRGFASFLMCRDCGAVPTCPHCTTSLTYHERGHMLMCHSCGRSWSQRAYPDPAGRCSNCGSIYLAKYGLGTQRVEDELHMLLGDGIDIIRMDADTTASKGAHQRLLERFDASECAVLVGTQMIAKGLDFPEVTLVGVVNADTTLKLPDFRAAERSYALLEQVAGRAGRGTDAGQVIIQSYWAGADAIQAVATHDRTHFIASELELRREAYYPPYARLANVVVWGTNEAQVTSYLNSIAEALESSIGEFVASGETWELVGPASCIKARIKDRYRRHLLIKAPAQAELGPLVRDVLDRLKTPRGIRVAVDVDPYDMM
ncbi:MAG: primosomal protein N' [Atopobiaceae bacterium]|nr:primosomal protein N' [Atopobiaceae bacterium]